METEYYYDAAGVQVTISELIVNGSRYYLDDVNAVFVSKQANYRRYPIAFGVFFLIIGMACCNSLFDLSLFFFIGAIGAFICAFLMKNKYALRLRTRFGENRPLLSTDPRELEAIQTAIYHALEGKRKNNAL